MDEAEVLLFAYCAEFPDATFDPQGDDLVARINEQHLEDRGNHVSMECVLEVHLLQHRHLVAITALRH